MAGTGLRKTVTDTSVTLDVTGGTGGGTPDDDSVTTAKLADGSVTTPKLASAAVTEAKIASSAVTNDKLANGAVDAFKLEVASVTETRLADSAVAARGLATDAVETAKIRDLAVTGGKLADGAVTAPKIGNNAVTEAKLANNSVTGGKIADGEITGAKIVDRTITREKLANAAVGTLQIDTAAVGSQQLQVAAVGTPSVANDAITEPKLSAAVRTKLNATGGDGTGGGGAYIETEILTEQPITTTAFVASTETVDGDADAFSVTITTGETIVYDTFSRAEFDALPDRTAANATRDANNAIRLNGAWIAKTASGQILASAQGENRSISVTSYEFEDAAGIVLADDSVTPPMLDADTDSKALAFRTRLRVPTFNNVFELGDLQELTGLTNAKVALIGDSVPNRQDKSEDFTESGAGGTLKYTVTSGAYTLEFLPNTWAVAALRNHARLTIAGESAVQEHVLYLNGTGVHLTRAGSDPAGVYNASVSGLLAGLPPNEDTVTWNVLSGTQGRAWLFVDGSTKEGGEVSRDELKRWFDLSGVAEHELGANPPYANLRWQLENFTANTPNDYVVDWSEHPARPYAEAVLPNDTVIQFFPGNYPIAARRNTYIARLDSNDAARIGPDRMRISVTGTANVLEATMTNRRVQGPFTYYDVSVAAGDQALYRAGVRQLGFNFRNSSSGTYLWQTRASSERQYATQAEFDVIAGTRARTLWALSGNRFALAQFTDDSNNWMVQQNPTYLYNTSSLPRGVDLMVRVKMEGRPWIYSRWFLSDLILDTTLTLTQGLRGHDRSPPVVLDDIRSADFVPDAGSNHNCIRMNIQGRLFLWFGRLNNLLTPSTDHGESSRWPAGSDIQLLTRGVW